MSIELLESIVNDLYEYAIMPKFNTLLKVAEKRFLITEEKKDTVGFAEWFIFNYKDSQSKEKLIDHYKLSDQSADIPEVVEALDAIKASKRSLYEVRSDRDQAVLKDIFNNDDFAIENTIVALDQMVSGRIVTLGHKHYLIGDIFEIESRYKESIVKYTLEQYNQYTVKKGMMTLDAFLDISAHLIYKVMDIVIAIDEENAFEEELMLYQASYGFRCSKDALYDRIIAINLPVFPDEEDEPILRVMQEGEIIAEIEITNGQFYVLCNNEAHLHQMIDLMSAVINEDIVFLKTETYSVDDLLQEAT